MRPTKISASWLFGALAFVLLAVTSGCHSLPPSSVAHQDSSKWEKEISAFEAQDKSNSPPKGCIVFVGSSSIRLWKTLQEDFPGYPVVNRGFGGSELADSYNLADRIVTPYAPRQVVIYAGGNDIHNGKDPNIVFGDLVALLARLHARLPEARLAYIASAPNPNRWAEVDKVKRLNSLAQAYCIQHHYDFINVFPLMLGDDDQPKPDIYVADRLHMNPKGYSIWKQAVAPVLR